MQPIQQTIDVATELNRFNDDPDDVDVLAHLQSLADQVQTVVPDCIGLSVAWVHRGLAFTLVASDEEIALLDAVQYLSDGPCIAAVRNQHGLAASADDLLSEERWQLLAQATAATSVRSTLTMPLVRGGDVVGTVNLYAASDHAFEGHHDELATILGASTAGVVRNADLSFSTRLTAEQSPAALEAQDAVDRAVGFVSSALRLTTEEAHRRLIDAARRAGIAPAQLATALLHVRR